MRSERYRINISAPLFILTLLLTSFCQHAPAMDIDFDEGSGKCVAENSFHKNVDASGIDKVSIETINGSIDVTGYDGKEVIIDALIKVKGEEQTVCDELLKKIKIKVDKEGKTLQIEPDLDSKKKGYNWSVSFTVQAPKKMEAKAETVNGYVTINNISGGNFETINGGINCIDMNGDVKAETINGGIEFYEVSGDAEASTINGSINLECKKVTPSDIDISTINGKISVKILKIPDAELDISAMNGSIKIEGLPNIEMKSKSRSFSSTLGSGKGNYELSTINGSVEFEVGKAE
ncbi:hypothetical protein K9N50_08310 [bacterium]|nr:hypothetical protein [bacterium]